MNIYTDHGYKDRNDYLQSLSDEYGPEEDFDGLVAALEDMG